MMKNYLVAILIFMLFSCENSEKSNDSLPYLGRHDYQEKEVNGTLVTDTVYHTIADFSFVNQDSQVIDNDLTRGKVYVADFFFTSCPTICPVMKSQMLRVYEEYKDNSEFIILSHTIDPEYDTVALLNDYARRLGVSSNSWHFLTGNKEKIYDIGQNSYMVTAKEDENEPGGYLHSGAFVLVDQQGRIRGIYDGTVEEDVDKLINDIPILLEKKDQQ